MTNMPSDVPKALKADSLGRVKTPPEQRERILDEFERSGLSGVKFAALVGIKYQTLASWVVRRRKGTALSQPAGKPADQVRWLESICAELKCGRGTSGRSENTAALKIL